MIDEEALAHYDAVIDALVAAGIRPNVTVHHFSSPVWVDDPRHLDCAGGPSDANLCGWADPVGAEQIIDELAEHARLLAQRYGDRVDEWGTLNEPVNYLLAATAIGQFPPGRVFLLSELRRADQRRAQLPARPRRDLRRDQGQPIRSTPTATASPRRSA